MPVALVRYRPKLFSYLPKFIREPSGKQMTTVLSVNKLTKHYGSFPANQDIDLDIKSGEVHALLGENGAGKSTLVKSLYGALQPKSGDIIWQGQKVEIGSPFEARKLGIGLVFQHFSLFDALSVAENIALSTPGGLSASSIIPQASELSERYGLPIQPTAMVGDLSVGERQRVEIIRCLLQDPQLLILDEPTSVLTPQETENLFKTINILKNEGKAILFISHRLEEVRQHCDRATVLRFGKVIATFDPRKETAGSIAKMMVGEDVTHVSPRQSKENGKPVLTIDNLNMPKPNPFSVALRDIKLSVAAGEILGIAGIAGNGQSELFSAISGETSCVSESEILLLGQSSGKESINSRRRRGAAFVPEERNGHAAVSDFSLSENVLLSRHSSDRGRFLWGQPLGLVNRKNTLQANMRISKAMDVRKNAEDVQASSLSGGNLQKFIMGRELDRKPLLLVINQPSWGVDAGAAARIRQSILDLANAGSAILIISQDLDEVLELSNKIAVLHEGKLSKTYKASEIDRETIGLLMAGVNSQGELSDVA